VLSHPFRRTPPHGRRPVRGGPGQRKGWGTELVCCLKPFPIPYSLFSEGLSALVADLVHIFDSGFVDEGLLAAAELEGVAVVPLDAAFDQFPVFEDEDHGGLRLNLFLQIEELGLLLGRVLLVILAVAKGGQTEGSDGDRRLRRYAWVRD